MIIIQQTTGSSLSNLIVDEVKFQEETGATNTLFVAFEYDGADWQYNGSTITDQQLEDDYGISFTGTPVATDVITVAYTPSTMNVFQAGKGVNSVKVNANFAAVQQQTNTNESAINTISATALKKDGSNLTQSIINDFQSQTPNVLTASGSITLTDNSSNFLTLTGNGTIVLPTLSPDTLSHTIILVIEGSEYSLNLGTVNHLYNPIEIDTTETYSVMYIYNKIDNSWYYCLTQ